LNLYLHDLPVVAALAELLDQASLALAVGFDGVTFSEHHAGFPGYLPTPLQMAGWVLARHPSGWAAPLPFLLPLRPTGILIEDLAWLAAGFPERVGFGAAPGYLFDDYTIHGVPFENRYESFWRAFDELAAAAAGAPSQSLFFRDPAVAGPLRDVPLVVATKSPRSVRRAAAANAGVMPPRLSDEAASRLFAEYSAAGGSGPWVIIRWAWLGSLVDQYAVRRRQAYDAAGGDHRWRSPTAEPPTVSTDEGDLAHRLAEGVLSGSGTCLSLRLHLPGLEPRQVRRQIESFAGVLPRLRHELSGLGSGGRLL
jgi:alkanesulfonate monooxygenase SsuD/methylene tetrahydromethanopterin reductase-like flavin-dependent oxidoreductase (luciferase family)